MKTFACLMLFAGILGFSLPARGQSFVVVWPDEAGDARLTEMRLTFDSGMYDPDFGDVPWYRPQDRDWAYTFHTVAVRDTTNFATAFPRMRKSFPPYVLETVGAWNLEESEKELSKAYGRRWRSARRFVKVLRGLLGPSFSERKGKGWHGNAYTYEGAPVQILWDDPRKMSTDMLEETNGMVRFDTVFDCSLRQAKWVIFGREPAKKKQVLLLLTKELHQLPDE